jgi:hypothetical protein
MLVSADQMRQLTTNWPLGRTVKVHNCCWIQNSTHPLCFVPVPSWSASCSVCCLRQHRPQRVFFLSFCFAGYSKLSWWLVGFSQWGFLCHFGGWLRVSVLNVISREYLHHGFRPCTVTVSAGVATTGCSVCDGTARRPLALGISTIAMHALGDVPSPTVIVRHLCSCAWFWVSFVDVLLSVAGCCCRRAVTQGQARQPQCFWA